MVLVLINVLPNVTDIIGHSSVVNNHVVIMIAKYYDFVNKNPALGIDKQYIH